MAVLHVLIAFRHLPADIVSHLLFTANYYFFLVLAALIIASIISG